jgi:hypothetical protein
LQARTTSAEQRAVAAEGRVKELEGAVRVLGEECRIARVCASPDPLYGWDEPRHLDDSEPEWYQLGDARQRVNANPTARAAVEGKG